MSGFSGIKEAAASHILLAAHRGIAGGNIPCNTIAAFEIALRQGTDIMELDVQKSSDGEFYVFHEGQEPNHLNAYKDFIKLNPAEAIKYQRYVNVDRGATQFGVNTLDETLEYLKDKCYINLDHCWHFFPEVVKVVRRHKMEDQIILKSGVKPQFIDAIEECAPDIAFMPIAKEVDDCFDMLQSKNINFIGTEVVFAKMDSELATEAYVEKMHKAGKVVWVNSLIYRYTTQLAGGMSDDLSLTGDPADGWGKLSDIGYDIIQSDWVGMCKDYLIGAGKYYRK